MSTPRVSREQAELLEILNGTDYFADLGKYAYELTLDEATRWLREVKGWHVYSEFDFDNGNWNYVIQDLNDIDIEISDNPFDTTDLALSAGIDLILKKLNDGE
jgi:hypothetical protein